MTENVFGSPNTRKQASERLKAEYKYVSESPVVCLVAVVNIYLVVLAGS